MKLKLDNAYENNDFKNSFIMDFFHDQTLQLSKPLTYKGLTLVGISNPKKDDGQRYITLTEGIKSGEVIIKDETILNGPICEAGGVDVAEIEKLGEVYGQRRKFVKGFNGGNLCYVYDRKNGGKKYISGLEKSHYGLDDKKLEDIESGLDLKENVEMG